MKCWFHPEQDAVAFCKSCGKGVCQDCLVTFGGDSYCKDCIEHGKVAAVAPSPELTAAESVPMPTGKPSKAFFVVGGVGCIINAIAAIWFFFNTLVPGIAFDLRYFSIIGDVLLVIGLILASFGYLGMRRNYGSGVGTAGFAVAIVAGVLFLLWTFLTYVRLIPFYQLLWIYILATIYEMFFTMMILWAVTHITTRRFTGKSGLSLSTGIMLIMTAVFLDISTSLWIVFMYMSYPWGFISSLINIFELIWQLLFLVSEILATILFFTAKVPESSAKPQL